MRLLLVLALLPAVAPAADPKPKLDLHGDPLPDKAVTRLGTVKYRVPGLAGVGFKKTGELVALTDKLELHTFPADGGAKATVTPLRDKPTEFGFWRLAISADARFAAAHIGTEKTLKVWDISGAKPVEHLTREMNGASTVAFSSDGRWLAVNDSDRNQALPVLLCDVATKTWESFPLPRGSYVEQFNFTADGKWLATTTGEQVTVIETAAAKTLVTVTIPRTRLSAGTVSPDGKTVAVLPTSWLFGKEPTLKFFTTDNGSDAEGLTGPTANSRGVGFIPGGKTLWVSGANSVREWDPSAAKWLREVAAPTDWRTHPVWSADGKRFVTHNPKTLAFVDAKTWKALHPESLAAGPVEAIFGVTVSPDGKVIATDGEVIHLWDAATGKLRGTVKSSWGNRPTMAFLPDSKAFIAVVERNALAVFDSVTGKELRRFKVPEELEKKVSFKDIRLSADGKAVTAFAESASSQWKSASLRWDVETGEVNGQVEDARRADELLGVLRSPDGEWVAQGGTLTRTGVPGQKPLVVLPPNDAGFGSNSGVWSSDSTRVALVRAVGTPAERLTGGTMVVYDLTKQAKVTELNTGRVIRSAFSRDGTFLATMGNGQLVVWELEGGKEVFRGACDTGNTIYARAIAFTPDGKRLITGHDTAALVWDVSAATAKK